MALLPFWSSTVPRLATFFPTLTNRPKLAGEGSELAFTSIHAALLPKPTTTTAILQLLPLQLQLQLTPLHHHIHLLPLAGQARDGGTLQRWFVLVFVPGVAFLWRR